MKIIIGLCVTILILGGGFLWYSLRLPNEYGQFTGAPRVDVQELIEHPQAHLHQLMYIEGIVRKQCTTMGCYFFFQPGDRMLRVDIADIAMNAPRRNGHIAKLEGQIVPFGDGYQFSASAVKFE